MTRIASAITVLSAAMLAASIAQADFEPNDTFGTRAILDPGVTSVSDSLCPSVVGEGPDTTLGAFYTAGGLIQCDDDSSTLGDGRASGLFDISVNSDGSIRLKVSGCADFNFDGNDDVYGDPHEEAGAYDLHVRVYDISHQQVDYTVLADTLVAGAVDGFDLFGYPSSGTFDAYIDNTPGGAEDPIDFMTFTGLQAGQLYAAEITSAGFDTLLGWLDNSGVLIDKDDDSGAGQLSKMYVEAPGDGMLNLAVTGYPDSWFEGFHAQEGGYTLQVTAMIGGDANGDNCVNLLDLIILANNWEQSPRVWDEGDFSRDELVNLLDLIILANNWDEGCGSQVPEPAGIMVLAVAALALKRTRSSRAGSPR